MCLFKSQDCRNSPSRSSFTTVCPSKAWLSVQAQACTSFHFCCLPYRIFVMLKHQTVNVRPKIIWFYKTCYQQNKHESFGFKNNVFSWGKEQKKWKNLLFKLFTVGLPPNIPLVQQFLLLILSCKSMNNRRPGRKLSRVLLFSRANKYVIQLLNQFQRQFCATTPAQGKQLFLVPWKGWSSQQVLAWAIEAHLKIFWTQLTREWARENPFVICAEDDRQASSLVKTGLFFCK